MLWKNKYSIDQVPHCTHPYTHRTIHSGGIVAYTLTLTSKVSPENEEVRDSLLGSACAERESIAAASGRA